MNLFLLKEYIRLILIENKNMNDSLQSSAEEESQTEWKSPGSDKSYSELLAELRYIGPAIPVIMAKASTAKMCGNITYDVSNYLLEKGFTISTIGAGKYGGHIDFSVFTSDKGWVSVDPTFIQFCGSAADPMGALEGFMDKNNLECEDIKDNEELINKAFEEEFKTILDYSYRAVGSGLDAFEITIFGDRYIDPKSIKTEPERLTYLPYSSYKEMFEKQLEHAKVLRSGEIPRPDLYQKNAWVGKIANYYKKSI